VLGDLLRAPDWLVTKFSSRSTGVRLLDIVIAAALTVIFGRAVLYVTILSVVALIPNYAPPRHPLKRNELATADPLALAGDVELLPEAQEDVARRNPGRISGGRR
jgi:hypothetical protein